MRASNPLFPPRKALKKLKVRCPLTQRFPMDLTGIMMHYEDVIVSVQEIIDKGGPRMDVHKMWRLVLWIFLGNGGFMHQPWQALRDTPCGKSYRKTMRQPLEVLRWTIGAVHATGSLMRVIGSDGLDKKSRLAGKRILWICDWHTAVPRLVTAFHEGSQSFTKALNSLPGFKGDLTKKEIMILLSASSYKEVSRVGAEDLPFGQGAKNGAMAFCQVPQMDGKDAAHKYDVALSRLVPQLEQTIARLFPHLPVNKRKVIMGDIEPCLCGAFIYSKMVEKLRESLPNGRFGPAETHGESNWGAVCKLRVPAGFIPHDLEGTPEASNLVGVPHVPYARFKLKSVPPPSQLTRKRLFARWGGPWMIRADNLSKKIKAQRAEKNIKKARGFHEGLPCSNNC
ncbi:unnamed protein product [Polarella glacialis]|uniref:Uncharacterized protein n=1 Tax=Polarella glacialis TaxID=89957 RepID=A0A813J4V5_POLGL|nr:unnamed protein product [Polarella glacialis]